MEVQCVKILLYASDSAEGCLSDPEKAKDPGIPANFPYKDQILAEIAEERRQVAEAKEKRKEEKQAAKLAVAEVEDETQAAAGPSRVTSKKGAIQPASSDDEDAPILLNPEYPHFRAIFEKSDVILHVLDARDPLSFRSSQIESLVSKKPEQRFAFILNKAGVLLLNQARATAWLTAIRHVSPGVRSCVGSPSEDITSNPNILFVWRWVRGIRGCTWS